MQCIYCPYFTNRIVLQPIDIVVHDWEYQQHAQCSSELELSSCRAEKLEICD